MSDFFMKETRFQFWRKTGQGKILYNAYEDGSCAPAATALEPADEGSCRVERFHQ
jgi:hypothetical protein